MNKNKMLKSNTYLVNASICIVILLIMCYFGINTSVKVTYSAAGTSGAVCRSNEVLKNDYDFSLIPLKYEIVAQYCCPTGYSYSNGYCVKPDYELKTIDGISGARCVQSVTDTSFWTFNEDKICSNELGDEWQNVPDSCEYKDNSMYATCQCYYTKTSVTLCTAKAENPTYPDGACFKKSSGGYAWSTIVQSGYSFDSDSSAALTEDACKSLDAASKAGTYQCYEKSGSYVWTNNDAYYTGQGYGYAYSYTTKATCIANNSYSITYTDASGTATNMPDPQSKVGGVSVVLSSKSPQRDGATFLGWGTSSATTASISPSYKYSVDQNLDLYAFWELKGLKSVDSKYGFVSGSSVISKVAEGTTLNDLDNDIELYSGFKLVAQNLKTVNGKGVLYTGGVVEVQKNTAATSNKYDSYVTENYTTVVDGDVNGDGQITMQDYVAVYRHLSRNYSDNLTGVYLSASDFNASSGVDMNDYVAIYNYLRNNKYNIN